MRERHERGWWPPHPLPRGCWLPFLQSVHGRVGVRQCTALWRGRRLRHEYVVVMGGCAGPLTLRLSFGLHLPPRRDLWGGERCYEPPFCRFGSWGPSRRFGSCHTVPVTPPGRMRLRAVTCDTIPILRKRTAPLPSASVSAELLQGSCSHSRRRLERSKWHAAPSSARQDSSGVHSCPESSTLRAPPTCSKLSRLLLHMTWYLKPIKMRSNSLSMLKGRSSREGGVRRGKRWRRRGGVRFDSGR